MVRKQGVLVVLAALALPACASEPGTSTVTHQLSASDYGMQLVLPIPEGIPQSITRGYDSSPTHLDHTGCSTNDIWCDRYAVDFSGDGCTSYDTPVLAAAAGVVELHGQYVDSNVLSDYGVDQVVLDHGNSCITQYAHLASRVVSDGQYVEQGQIIGYQGNEGNVSGTSCQAHPGTHLHFKLVCNGASTKPEPLSGYVNLAAGQVYRADGYVHYPVGTIVKVADQPELYLVMSDSQLMHIPDWGTYVAHHLFYDASYPLERVVTISQETLGCYNVIEGPGLQTQSKLMVCNGSQIYVLFNDGVNATKRQVPFVQSDSRYAPLIKSWGFRMNELVAGSTSECGSYAGSTLKMRPGTVVEEASDNDFWVVTADSYQASDASTQAPTTYARRLYRNENGQPFMPVLYGNYKVIVQIPDGSVGVYVDQVQSGTSFGSQEAQVCSTSSGGQGGGSSSMTIDCQVSGTAMNVTVTGPIQEGVYTQVTDPGTYLEYGSDTDGWGAYTSGKPSTEWTGDWVSTGIPRAYSLTLDSSVQNMNFFLYNPSSGQQGWFNLDDWTVTGDCWRDGGGIRHTTPPPVTGSISCTLDSSNLAVYINGPVESLLVYGSVLNPTKILYGSDTDGWVVPYSSGKAFATWNGSDSYVLYLPPNVYNFNMYLTDGSTGKWFDLNDADGDGDSWTVGGACWKNGGVITHAPPPKGTINCVENGADMTVTVTGNIPYGIFGSVPSGSPVYLEYGSDTDGWSPYTTGKPKATWSSSTTSYSLILGSSVQNMNFFLYSPSSGQTSWFNLDSWDVIGDCWRNGGGILH